MHIFAIIKKKNEVKMWSMNMNFNDACLLFCFHGIEWVCEWMNECKSGKNVSLVGKTEVAKRLY